VPNLLEECAWHECELSAVSFQLSRICGTRGFFHIGEEAGKRGGMCSAGLKIFSTEAGNLAVIHRRLAREKASRFEICLCFSHPTPIPPHYSHNRADKALSGHFGEATPSKIRDLQNLAAK